MRATYGHGSLGPIRDLPHGIPAKHVRLIAEYGRVSRFISSRAVTVQLTKTRKKNCAHYSAAGP